MWRLHIEDTSAQARKLDLKTLQANIEKYQARVDENKRGVGSGHDNSKETLTEEGKEHACEEHVLGRYGSRMSWTLEEFKPYITMNGIGTVEMQNFYENDVRGGDNPSY